MTDPHRYHSQTVADVSSSRHRPDTAFREHRSDRLMIRRFRAGDAAALAAYRSDPAVARYQSWDIPFSHAQAQSFIETLEAADPDSPGEWFQFALVEAATGVHIGDVAAGVDVDHALSVGTPRPSRISRKYETRLVPPARASRACRPMCRSLCAVIVTSLAGTTSADPDPRRVPALKERP